MMDIKCAALVLVILIVTVELTETFPLHRPPLLPGIIVRKNMRLYSGTEQRDKRSVEDTDKIMGEYMATGLADKPHSRNRRRPPSGIMTRMYTRIQSKKHKGEKRSLEDVDMALDKYMALGLADKPHSRNRRMLPPQGIMTKKRTT